MNGKKSGFTIVELLIVIVVIAILAAVTMVAFNGVQNRAHDTAVFNDLANMRKKVELYKIDFAGYPSAYTGYVMNQSDATHGIYKSGFAKDSYELNLPRNLIYCVDDTATAGVKQEFAVLAMSKSGQKMYISGTTSGVIKYDDSLNWSSASPSTMCDYVIDGPSINQGGTPGYLNTANPSQGWQW